MWSGIIKMTVNQACICADRLSFCLFLWLFSLSLILFNLSLWCLFSPQVWELQLQSSFIPVVFPIIHRSDGLLYPTTHASAEGGAQFPRSHLIASRSLVPVQYGGVYFFYFLLVFFPFNPNDAHRLCSVDWTECNDYAAVSPVGRGLLGYDSELNPASPGFPQALQS